MKPLEPAQTENLNKSRNSATSFVAAITDYLQRDDTLPLPQLRRLGLIYSSYSQFKIKLL